MSVCPSVRLVVNQQNKNFNCFSFILAFFSSFHLVMGRNKSYCKASASFDTVGVHDLFK